MPRSATDRVCCRLPAGLLPWRVISYSTYHALAVVPMFPAYYIFNALLCALQVLHVIWTWLILRIA